jgi:probable HAF family extracellular repeat protein
MNWIRLASILAAVGFVAKAGPIYTLADLGTLGGAYTMGTGLNASGQAVGTGLTSNGYMHAFSSSGSGLTDLTGSSSGNEGEAAAINNAGKIAGTQYIGGQTYATVWNKGVATTVGDAGSFALAINSSGDVAGMLVNNGQGNAFASSNGTVIDLGAFAGSSWSSAYALNDSGQAAGYGMVSNGVFRDFVWTPGQGYAALGTLGGVSSYAMAINNAGIVAGSSQISNGYSHAFVSTGTSLHDLGTLGGGSSYGYGINNLGNVVGYSWTSGNASMDGFLEEGGVMWDINSLLVDAPGWVVTQLYAINDSNQVVGVGVLNGVEHAVLLTDPPPVAAPAPDPNTSSTPEQAVWIYTLSGLATILFASRLRRLQRIPLPARRR